MAAARYQIFLEETPVSAGSSSVSNAKDASTSTFVTALVFNGAVAAIEIIIFTILRPRFKAIYEPRTYVPEENKRVGPLGAMFAWPTALLKLDIDDIKRTNGLDAYMFVRFLRMMVVIFLPLWFFSWALFLPLHAVGTTNDQIGLDRFTFGNVAPTQQARYAAHIIFMYLMTGWIFWNIKQEMSNFITTRQRFLVDPEHSKTAQASTVLITGVPRKYLDEAVLAQLFSHLPGGAKAIWLNRNLKDMPKVYDRRMKACNKLESAEKTLIAKAVELHSKGKVDVHDGHKSDPNLSLAEQLVPREERPTHRLSVLGFLPFGQKVDSIDWARNELMETNAELDRQRNQLRKDVDMPGTGENETYPPLNSAFVLFNQQIAAHLATNSLIHNEPYRMAEKHVEVAPEDVIWGNLGMNPYEKKIRLAISYAATAALILGWAIPVALVGIIGNVTALSKKYSWLAWLGKLPSPVLGIIQGILPPVLLAVLTMLLPIILRLLASFEGIPRKTGLELSLMTRFFIFQVIHSFLIVTISGGLIQALPGLAANPSQAPTLLAQNLPSAATFFITYIILQGLSGVGGGFLQIVPLIVYYVKLKLLGSTPRAIYNIKYTMRDVAWGTTFPGITLVTVIALVYTPLQPLVTGFAVAAFFLFYMLYKYLFLFVYDQPRSGDTGGLFFPKAIQHIFVGLYVQQVCIAALFFLAQNQNSKPSAVPEGALTVVLIVLTIGFNLIINNSYGPLLTSLPLTLAHKSYGMPQESNSPDELNDGDDNERRRLTDGQYNGTGKEQGIGAIVDRQPAVASRVPPTEVNNSRFDQAGKIETHAGRPTNMDGSEDEDGNEVPLEKVKEMPTDFNHPASVEPQRTIWLPRDTLGLADSEVRNLEANGIDASTQHADINEKGKITIDGRPPEM
ncbi:hypothetical protein FRB96_008373 [Tulasnella sp. 330]|nr:hypothetical protein FRB96_008373 [Tulasnella sp. 330]KAG8873232.1 hypothetical protein FRB98_009141 [Tulasnella sp. 332]